jgi:alanyl-tRNA synthetase
MGGDYSTELCGGTHVERTGDIGLIKILSESAVAAGVRRIEALTGKVALDYLESQDTALLEVATILKTNPGEVISRVQGLVDERKKMERELVDLRKKLASVGGDGKDTALATKDICGIPFASRLITDMPAKDLKGLADEVKGQIGSGVVALISVTDSKVSLVVAVSDDLSGKVNAVDLVCIGAAEVGGRGGGGRPDMAQAGGPDVAKASVALEAIEKALSS